MNSRGGGPKKPLTDLGTWTTAEYWQDSGGNKACAIHMTLLPNKKLLIWNWDRDNLTGYDFRTWIVSDLSTTYDYKKMTEVSFPYSPIHDHELFCAGHALTYDGKLFAPGGHVDEDKGIYRSKIYDYANGTTGSWSEGANLTPIPTDFPNTGGTYDNYGRRWYPTVLHLPNRRMLIMGGTRFENVNNLLPEIWAPSLSSDTSDTIGQFPPKYNGQQQLQHNYWFTRPYYPHAVVDPRDGNVLVFGGSNVNDPADTGDTFSGPNKRLDLVTLDWTETLPWTNGSGSTDDVPATKENYPSAVMIDGIVVRSGGSANGAGGELHTANTTIPSGFATPATKNAAFVKLVNWDGSNVSSPIWEKAPNSGTTAGQMFYARKNHTLVGLPTGEIVAMGGNYARNNPDGTDEGNPEGNPPGSGPFSISGATLRTAPEKWNPLSPGTPWALWAAPPTEAQMIGRPYHSTAVLLPDARIIIAGGEKEPDPNIGDLKRKFQIFSPPYGGTDEWEADRPTWNANPPSEVWYGQTGTLSIEVAEGRQVSKIALVSLGSNTHAFAANQRVVFLAKGSLPTTGSGTVKSVSVTMPSSPKLAPPGYYMLFAVDNEGTGVPSEAKIIKLKDHAALSVSSAEVLVGSASGSTSAPDRLRVACNDYYGDTITSTYNSTYGAYTVEIQIQNCTDFPFDLKELRTEVEFKTSAATTLKALVRNYDTSQWEQVGSNLTTSTTETLATFQITPLTTATAKYYDNGEPTSANTRFRWTAASSFTVKIDATETAVKP